MRTGTKSILFGVHQFLLHPVLALLAWWRLYGRPSWLEFVCICIHDLGYWGKRHMDDEEGERHVEWAASKANKWFGVYGWHLCAGHSRHYATLHGLPVSRLFYSDKLAITLYPAALYYVLGRASGELREYRRNCAAAGFVPAGASFFVWKETVDRAMHDIIWYRDPDAAPYVNGERHAKRNQHL